jgi:hypothetical protein
MNSLGKENPKKNWQFSTRKLLLATFMVGLIAGAYRTHTSLGALIATTVAATYGGGFFRDVDFVSVFTYFSSFAGAILGGALAGAVQVVLAIASATYFDARFTFGDDGLAVGWIVVPCAIGITAGAIVGFYTWLFWGVVATALELAQEFLKR